MGYSGLPWRLMRRGKPSFFQHLGVMEKQLCFCFYIVLSLITTTAFAQKYDYIWYLGYDSHDNPAQDGYGTTVLDFSYIDRPLATYEPESNLDFRHTHAGICDEEGNLLFYFNGQNIQDASFGEMPGGGSINVDEDNIGYDLSQGAIVLPRPGYPDHYVLFHEALGTSWFGWGTYELRYSVIDMNGNNGLGEVVQRRRFLLYEPLAFGQLTATKHANGRDWWLLVNPRDSNVYYRYLLDPSGVLRMEDQVVGGQVLAGVGQAVFSPNGTQYARFNTVSAAAGRFVDIYSFDRCTGLLNNPIKFQFDPNTLAGGAAISPNSRYLYTSYRLAIDQYDLQAPDILASRQTVAEYDGFVDPFPTTFYQMQLAPDGKIYVSASNSTHYLHVIHQPDLPGLTCQVEQHAYQLPTRNAFSIPNFPNYRLGPIDGSPCDTLGINNVPVALFRYAADTMDYRSVVFHDLSYYEPQEWLWDFGDGNGSTDQHPQHTYAQDGLYQVCLTVSNANGEHTLCRTVLIGTVATQEPHQAFSVKVYPNPVQDRMVLEWGGETAQFTLSDALGRLVLQGTLRKGNNAFDLGRLPAGLYVYSIVQGGKAASAGKIVKL